MWTGEELDWRRSGAGGEAAKHGEALLGRLPADSYLRGFVLCALGRHDEAPPFWERIPNTATRVYFWDPLTEPLRDTPRLAEILANVKRTEEYRTARETIARMQKERAAGVQK